MFRHAGSSPTALVPDELWVAVEPLMPREPPKTKDGRPRVPTRQGDAGPPRWDFEAAPA